MPKLVQRISHFIRFSSQFGSEFGPASVRERKRLWKMNKKVFLLARNFCCHAKWWLSPGVNYFMLNLHLPPEWRCKAAISEVLRFKATIPEAYTRLMAEILFGIQFHPKSTRKWNSIVISPHWTSSQGNQSAGVSIIHERSTCECDWKENPSRLWSPVNHDPVHWSTPSHSAL